MMHPELLKKLVLNNFCKYDCAFTVDVTCKIRSVYANMDSMHIRVDTVTYMLNISSWYSSMGHNT